MSVPCQRNHCSRDVFPNARAPVTVADTEQKWCLDCIEDEFGVSYTEYVDRQESIVRFITPRTTAAFFLGVSLTMLFVLLF